MDEDRVDASLQAPTEATGRRSALRSLATAGVALPAALGLTNAAAKNKKHGGKGRKNQKQKHRQDGEREQEVTAQAPPPDVGPPGGLPVQGPTMDTIPQWRLVGDWFDVCKCDLPCPCTFAQPPTGNTCQGVLAYHIRQGRFGHIRLDGLNLIAVVTFAGNVWAGETRIALGQFIDERANVGQRQALQMIFGGQAGGWPAQLATLFGEIRGIEFVPIEFEIAGNLAFWRAAVPGRIEARAEALTGPTTPPGQRVQLHNPPGSEVGPGQVATWGRATANRVKAFGFTWEWDGKSSKHIPFNWSGPDPS